MTSQSFGWLLLGIAAAWMLHVLIHALGYVVAARFARVRIIIWQVGAGRVWKSFRTGSCFLELRRYPVRLRPYFCAANTHRYARRRRAIHYTAVGFTVAAVALAMAWYQFLPKPYNVFQFDEWGNLLRVPKSTLGSFLEIFWWVGALQLMTGFYHFDGAQLSDLAEATDDYVAVCVLFEQFRYAHALGACGDTRRATLWYVGLTRRAIRQRQPSLTLFLIHYTPFERVAAPAIQCLRDLADDAWIKSDDDQPIDAAETLAALAIEHDRRDLIAECLPLFRRIIEHRPDAITYQGTLGSLLVAAGEPTEALPILETVARESASNTDRAICLAYLAAAHARLGHPDLAAKFRDASKLLKVDHHLVHKALSDPALAE